MNQFWHIIISPYGHQVLMQFIQSTFFQREKNPTTRTHVQFNSEEKSVAIQVALSTNFFFINNGKMSEVPQISSHRQQNP